MGLDADKQPIDALASNMGHCLWTGIVDEDRAPLVAEKLLSKEMFSGWGIRTLAESEVYYNPLSYQNGSVWPHDSALCAAGLMRYRIVDEALRVIGKLTRRMSDVTLPATRDIAVGAETYAYHEEIVGRMPGRYMIPTRRSLQNLANAKAGEYIRSHWRLELLRRTIDDAFRDVDVVVLPTRRRTPRTVDASIKREETDVPRNPELENTGAFNTYGIPCVSGPCGFTSAGLPVGLMIAGPRFSESKVLALARAFEQATEFHKRKPPITPETPVPPLAATEER